MSIVETYERDLVCRRSDSGFMIHKVGTDEYYEEAWDLQTSPYVYEETDIPINSEENPGETGEIDPYLEEYAQAGHIMLGE